MKKGFTLAELLGVMVILGILIAVMAPSLLSKLEGKKEEVNNKTKSILEEASIMYQEENGALDYTSGKTYCISIEDMINQGYLSKNFQDGTGDKSKTIDNKYVKIKKDGSNKSFIYDNIYTNSSCTTKYTS